MRSRIPLVSYLTLLLIAVLGSVNLLIQGASFRTDIFSLLPPIHRDTVLERATRAQAENLAKKLVIVVQSPSDYATEKEAVRVAGLLSTSGLFSSVQSRISVKDLGPLTEFFLKHSFQLAAAGVSKATLSNAERLISEARQRAFAADSPQWLQNANRDPLLLLPTYLTALTSNGGKYIFRNGFIHIDTPSSRNVLITADLRESPYSRATQERVVTFLNTLSPQHPLRLITSSIALFANDSAERAQREVTLISSVTLFTVVAIVVCVFRSIPVVLSLAACVVTSFLGSLWVTSLIVQWLFGHPLHLITLGFGSSLLGVAVDYGLHFFIAHRSTPPAEARPPFERIRSGLILGFVTTVIGFIGISASPFPGLRELAIFCVVGLTLSILTVTLVFPLIAGAPTADRKLAGLIDKTLPLVRPRSRFICGAILTGLCVFGVPRLTISDDIRNLHKPSSNLLNSQREIAELTGMNDGGTFAIIRAPSDEDALRIEEEVRARLDTLIQSGQLASYRALSLVVPSRHKQRETYQTIGTTIASAPESFAELSRDLHLSQESKETLLSTTIGEPLEYALPAVCITTRACRTVEDLWLGSQADQVVTTIALQGFKGDPQALKTGLSGSLDIINHADAISNALHLYRSSATITTGLFYCAVFAVLALRYGFRHLWRVILPPSLGALGALAALGLLGIPLNVFSMFALMVLLGVSVDYVIFFSEERGQNSSTHFSVFLSALTTIASFGALSFSSTSALQSFGIVLSVGIFFSALLAPLASHRSPER